MALCAEIDVTETLSTNEEEFASNSIVSKQQLVLLTAKDLEKEQVIGAGLGLPTPPRAEELDFKAKFLEVVKDLTADLEDPQELLKSASASTSDTSVNSTSSIEETIARTKNSARQKANESKVNKLIIDYANNCQNAESTALDFIYQNVNHPVFTCFHDLMNSNDIGIITSSKNKKLSNFELVVVSIGIIDSIAMTLNNPLYQDSFSYQRQNNWNRKIPKRTENLLNNVRHIIVGWGVSEKTQLQERFNTVIRFLRRLTPFFKAVDYDKTFELTISSIEHDVTTKVLNRQEKSSFLKSSTVAPKAKSTPNAMFDLFLSKPSASLPIKEEIKSANNGPSPTSLESSLQEDTSKKSAEPLNNYLENRKEDCKSKTTSISSTPPTPLNKKSNSNVVLLPSSPLNSKVMLIQADPPELKREIIILDENTKTLDEPNPKKAKLDIPASKDGPQEKPKVNAFALLMNRSRELAKATKGKEKPKGARR